MMAQTRHYVASVYAADLHSQAAAYSRRRQFCHAGEGRLVEVSGLDPHGHYLTATPKIAVIFPLNVLIGVAPPGAYSVTNDASWSPG